MKKIKIGFIYAALTAGIFGIFFTILPEFSLSLFGFSLNDQGYFMTRLFGGALIGYGLVNWFVKDGPPSDARWYFMLGVFADSVIAVIVFIFGLLQQIGNLLMLVPLIIHISLAIWFGYMFWNKIK